jgi:hypothetical protein
MDTLRQIQFIVADLNARGANTCVQPQSGHCWQFNVFFFQSGGTKFLLPLGLQEDINILVIHLRRLHSNSTLGVRNQT